MGCKARGGGWGDFAGEVGSEGERHGRAEVLYKAWAAGRPKQPPKSKADGLEGAKHCCHQREHHLGSAERGSKCAVEMRDRLEATVLYKGLGEASGDPRIIEFQSLLQKAPGAKAARPG